MTTPTPINKALLGKSPADQRKAMVAKREERHAAWSSVNKAKLVIMLLDLEEVRVFDKAVAVHSERLLEQEIQMQKDDYADIARRYADNLTTLDSVSRLLRVANRLVEEPA